MFIATLVAPERLSTGEISVACDWFEGKAGSVVNDVACDIQFENWEASDAKRIYDADWLTNRLDLIVQREADRNRKLLVADMDSTMITVECIDELAHYAGLKAEVSAVTERAMRGEIDFADALRDRVALLAGLSETTVADCLHERVKLMGGAKVLVQTFRANGGKTVLVSGGFTHFTDPVAKEIGFDRAIANRLVVRDGVLTGEVETPIVDAQTKKATLLEALTTLKLPVSASIAIGDGANDIPMIETAGLGVAFHAKPKTIAAADASVRFGDLSVVAYASGWSRADWVTA